MSTDRQKRRKFLRDSTRQSVGMAALSKLPEPISDTLLVIDDPLPRFESSFVVDDIQGLHGFIMVKDSVTDSLSVRTRDGGEIAKFNGFELWGRDYIEVVWLGVTHRLPLN